MNIRDPIFNKNDMLPRRERIIQKIYLSFLKTPTTKAITKLIPNKDKEMFISPIGSEKNIFLFIVNYISIVLY